MIQLQENAWAEGLVEGWKDGHTLLNRALPATAKGQKLTNMKTD